VLHDPHGLIVSVLLDRAIEIASVLDKARRIVRSVLQNRPELSSEGALLVLQAATAKAREIGVPQCIAIVDRGGHLLAFLPMDGAKVLSQWSATQKAVTAASSAAPSGELAEPLAAGLVAATQGRFTHLRRLRHRRESARKRLQTSWQNKG
jgi:hypothetical protein